MNTAAISGHQFAVIRVVLGLYLLCHFIDFYRTPLKCLAMKVCSLVSRFCQLLMPFPIYFQSQMLRRWCTGTHHAMVCAIMLSLGFGRRWVAITLWICWLSLFNRNPSFMGNPSIPFVGVALLLMAALPHGEPWARTKARP